MDRHCGGEDVNEATLTLKHVKKHFGLSTKEINSLKN